MGDDGNTEKGGNGRSDRFTSEGKTLASINKDAGLSSSLKFHRDRLISVYNRPREKTVDER